MGGMPATGGSPGTGGMTATGGTGGGAGGAGGMSMPMMTRAQACTEYAQAYAAKANACAPFLTVLNYGSQAAHATRLQYACNLVDLPGVTFPPIPFKPCADGIAAQSCDDWFDGVTPPGCAGVGLVADGGSCSSGYQCASAYCSLPTTGCGRCARAPGLNEQCVEGQCPNGLICNGSSYCVVPGARGARCSADAPCRPSLGCRSGFCAPRADVGANCFTLDDCNFPHAALCNTNIGRCVQVTTGSMCRVNPDYSVVACSASYFCRPDGGCVAPAADGAACSDQTGPSCLTPARCVDGRCKLYVPDKTCHP
jgi:hypothetical protein